MAQPQPEKRASRRFALKLPLAVKNSHKGETPAFTRDVSSRGICFYIDAPLEVGTDLQFVLTLPPEVTLTDEIHVRCFARVMRVDPSPKGNGVVAAAVIDRFEFLAER